MKLRYYQEEAVAAVYNHLSRKPTNPCVVIPTGGGKSLTMATICRDAVLRWNGRVLVLAHVKELLEQTAGTLRRLEPDLSVGVYSAGLGSRDTGESIIVAGIQSVYQKADVLGHFDLIIGDECFPAGTRIETPRGQVPIEDIYVGQSIYNAAGVGAVEGISARAVTQIIQIELCDGRKIRCTGNHPFFTLRGWTRAEKLEKGTYLFSRETVQMLREGIFPLDSANSRRNDQVVPERKGVEQAEILFNILFKNDGKSDVQPASVGQNEDVSKGKNAQIARRKWNVNGESSIPAATIGEWLENGICDYYDEESKDGRCAQILQSRFSPAGTENGYRIGWPFAPDAQGQSGGREKSETPCGVRVERVEIIELESPLVVYNLQVSKHPSYFADGVLVHNCHLLPEDGEGMYRTFLQAMKTLNPNVRLIGFTATPYRMKSGLICGPDNLLNEVCYEVGVKELIARGFLCPLKSKGSQHAVDTSNLHLRGGEFVADEVESLVGNDAFEQAACREIVSRTRDRKSVLVFAATVARAESVSKLLTKYSGQQCAVVTGETSSTERDYLLRRFKREPVPSDLFGGVESPLKFLVNVNVLTTGFDAPNIDCVVLLRPTASPGLYYQMVGRGFRLHESKPDTLVLDYGNNIMRHGPVDMVRIRETFQREGAAPAKECPKCHQIVHTAVSVCSDCGYEFPRRETNHERSASSEGVISGETVDTTYTVFDVDYNVHQKRGASDYDPRSVRVDYLLQRDRGFDRTYSEWVCPEHSGWARKKFEQWWQKRSNALPPETAEEVVALAKAGGVLPTVEITVRKTAGEKYARIIAHKLGESLPDPEKPTCDGCAHYAYGYCCVKSDHAVTPSTESCDDFLDKDYDADDIPF